MSLRDKVLLVLAAACAAYCVPAGVAAQSNTPSQGGMASLIVRAHPGAQAIDVDGRGAAASPVTLTLVSTLSRDIPDVVLSRKTVQTGADGAFSTTVSIAPGFLPGSILTVYASSPGGGPGAKAIYFPDAPNRGVVVPFEQLPRNVR